MTIWGLLQKLNIDWLLDNIGEFLLTLVVAILLLHSISQPPIAGESHACFVNKVLLDHKKGIP